MRCDVAGRATSRTYGMVGFDGLFVSCSPATTCRSVELIDYLVDGIAAIGEARADARR